MNIKVLHTQEKPVSATSLFKSELGNATAIQILKSEKLKEHITKTPALLICVEGEVIFENEKELYKVNIGDLLFNRTSETPSEIGLTSVYAGNDKNVVFGGFVIRGIFKDDSVAFDFKKVGFRSNIVRKQIIKYGQGAVRANIGQKDLEKVKIPVPPLPEQLS